MDYDFITLIIEVVILIAAFVVGKYIIPNISSNAMENFNLIMKYAETFVAFAKQFMHANTGEEKMEKVVSMLREIAVKYGIDITDEELTAIAQKAYNAMKKEDIEKTE